LVAAEDVTRGKPDPEPFLTAARGLGIPADRCVVIEDAPAGIEAGCAAGMQTVAVATTHAPHDLNKADVITGCLSDIHIENGSISRLTIRIEGDRIPASAR
jgi:sugar-phosphatase